ncbi:hypothetical protein GJ698_27585 [Pseudoduganella sp. FT26W]|uniref:Cell envelope integrity protein CreD n=1 Tax=Duganella aquatilis TaxID=2666082 RepID=A0A844DGF9_9BURK|nr:inner membrane CreD family protein [Duganella aquatilis]MRW87840.1 hypothetical protein [Duganella aquatilis]
MQKKLFQKCLIIVALMLLIGLPLMMVEGVISERIRFHEQAVQSIADDSVRAQHVIGPVLVLPYSEEIKDGDKVVTVQHRKLVFPNELRIAGKLVTERRYRGIHQVLMYSGGHSFAGDFTLPAAADLPRDSGTSLLTMRQPYVALSVSDVRGIRDIPTMLVAGRRYPFAQGARLPGNPSGMHVPLDLGDLKAAGASIPFGFSLYLAGTERQHFVPVGNNNLVTMESNWAHPQFGGNFLPEARTINDQGFRASWRISSMASNAQRQLAAMDRPAPGWWCCTPRCTACSFPRATPWCWARCCCSPAWAPSWSPPAGSTGMKLARWTRRKRRRPPRPERPPARMAPRFGAMAESASKN